MQVLLVGCGGYAAGYVRELLSGGEALEMTLAGIVDPFAALSPLYGQIQSSRIPVYDTAADFYAHRTADLAVISTPIYLHHAQALECLHNGSHLLLEKPMAATVKQAEDIVRAACEAHRKLGVGFQLCYDPVMLGLKARVDAGLLGAPVSQRGLILWPRPKAYYARSGGWAGRKCLSDGRPVYDSILTNATAHYLMNMLWLTGKGFDTQPATACEAQLGRAYPIETFDTLAARFTLACGTTAMLYLSHALDTKKAPRLLMEYVFEETTVRIVQTKGYGFQVTGTGRGGQVTDCGRLTAAYHDKLAAMRRAIADDAPLPCPGQAGLASMISNAMVFQNDLNDVETIRPVCEDDNGIWAPGLDDKLRRAYKESLLPREMGVSLSGA